MVKSRNARGRSRQPARPHATPRRKSERRAGRAPTPPKQPVSPTSEIDHFPVVGVGASAGGVEAFKKLLASLPADTGMAFVLIQHLDPTHESMLAEIVARSTSMPVLEVTSRMHVRPNHVYVIPPNTKIGLNDGVFQLIPRPKTRGRELPIDYFFESLAETYHSRAIGVILSGTLSDGALGLKAIKAEGGITFAQDARTARFQDMPRAAIAAGSVDSVLPPEGIARELARMGRHPYLRPRKVEEVEAAPEKRPGVAADVSELTRIFRILRSATGVDFSNYRPSTVRRRISRRMILNKVEQIPDYERMLKDEPSEVRALYEDILITVTGFFRDPETYKVLKSKIIPALLKNRSADQPIRIWVPGCSSGEEVYSIAIVLFESIRDKGTSLPVQIFATDISETAIERARAGIYLENALVDISPERRRRFFFRANGAFQVSKAIRDVCIFARQNIAVDPPFSNIDLLSCRNLLIYLEPALQKRIVPLFHYALKPQGYLLLGNSETLSTFPELFYPIDRAHRIFGKRPGAVRPTVDFGHRLTRAQAVVGESPVGRDQAPTTFDLQREADRIVINRYSPAGVIVNDSLEIVQFRGRTSRYLEPAAGAPSLNVLKMAREGLVVELRAAITKARQTGMRVRKEHIPVRQDGGFEEITLEVAPIKGGDRIGTHYLVLFEESRKPSRAAAHPTVRKASVRDEQAIVKLEQELTATKEYLQSIIEEQEASNEELKSANEEVLSSNEELQSTNEELETAKEELQSTNEELQTVNEELQGRNLELLQANNDLVNLLGGVNMAIVMVGMHGQIRRVTAAAEGLLNIRPADVGRPIGDLKSTVDDLDLADLVHRVIESAAPVEREVNSRDGRWFLMRIRPYRTMDNRIEGAVIAFVDIDPLKRSIESLRSSEVRYHRLFETAREGILLQDGDTGEILDVNPFVLGLLGYTRDELVGRKAWEVSLYADPEAARRRFRQLDQRGYDFQPDVELIGKSGEPIRVEKARSSFEADGRTIVQSTLRDISERQRMEEELRHAQKMESIGRLAGGIAHDFNNILNIISAYSTLLAKGDAGKRTQSLEAIEKAVDRGAALVRQLLTFARRETMKFEPVDVNSIVREVASMIQETFPRSISIGLELEAEVPRINANPSQLHQALLNLCVNSRDAMPKGGKLQLATALARGESLRARRLNADQDRYICIGVSDTGTGMDEETRTRIFEPFFSTKGKEQGSGLGLAVVYGVAKTHGGLVDVESKPGEGSRFSIYLPLGSLEAERTRPEREESTPSTQGKNEAILVVEDEALLLESMKTLIESAGYRVLVARDGVEAVELYDRHREDVAVVLADLGLPRLGGWEAFLEMKKINPAVRAIFTSGTIERDQRTEMKKHGVAVSVRKPFTETEMLGAIRRALRSPASH